MAKEAREFVFLECEVCGSRNYRTPKRVKGVQTKLKLKKFCPHDRKHTIHKEKRK